MINPQILLITSAFIELYLLEVGSSFHWQKIDALERISVEFWAFRKEEISLHISWSKTFSVWLNQWNLFKYLLTSH